MSAPSGRNRKRVAGRGPAATGDGLLTAQMARAVLAATTETLRLIGASPGDLTAVLHGILAKAAELCGGDAGSITLKDGGAIRYMASHGPAMEPYVGTTAPAGMPSELIGKHVLLVDDNAINCRILDLQTEAWSIHGHSVETGEDALAMIERGDPFDLAILVTHRVHAAVEERVTASSLGEHDLKGLSRPVPLYQIDGMRG